MKHARVLLLALLASSLLMSVMGGELQQEPPAFTATRSAV